MSTHFDPLIVPRKARPSVACDETGRGGYSVADICDPRLPIDPALASIYLNWMSPLQSVGANKRIVHAAMEGKFCLSLYALDLPPVGT